MGWDKAVGNRAQFKGLLKKRRGDLTDDGLTRIAGKRPQLGSCLQTRYGLSETQAGREIAAFESTSA